MTSGWILPVCYECWLEICRFEADDSDEMRKSYIKSTSESPLPNERRWSQYDSKQKQWVKHARDISEKANMIKAKYRQRMNEREDSKAN